LLSRKISFHLFVCSRSDKPIPSLAQLFSSLCIVLEILILSNFCNQSFWSLSRSISKQAAITGVKASSSQRGGQQGLVRSPARSRVPPPTAPHGSFSSIRAEVSSSAEPEPPHFCCKQHPCTCTGIGINIYIQLQSKSRHAEWFAGRLPATTTHPLLSSPKTTASLSYK